MAVSTAEQPTQTKLVCACGNSYFVPMVQMGMDGNPTEHSRNAWLGLPVYCIGCQSIWRFEPVNRFDANVAAPCEWRRLINSSNLTALRELTTRDGV